MHRTEWQDRSRLWRQAVLPALALTAVLALVPEARAQRPSDRTAAAEAQQRAKAALAARNWQAAVPDAVKAATLNPYRQSRLIAAVALVYTDAWREAAVWLQAVDPDEKVDDADVRQWLALLAKRGDALQTAVQDCGARLTREQFTVLARFVPVSQETKNRVAKRICVRAQLPALGPGVKVLQGKRTVTADADGLHRVAAGRVDVVVGSRSPVALEVRGEEDQVVTVRLPDEPGLRGSILVRGLPADGELLLDGTAVAGRAGLIALAPATHTLVARAPGRVEVRETLAVGIAQDRTVDLRLRMETPAAAKWLMGGGALVAAAGGAGFWLWGVKPMQDELDTAQVDPVTGREANLGYQDRAETVDSANRAQWMTGAVIGAGATALLTGLIWWATFDDTPPEWAGGPPAGP